MNLGKYLEGLFTYDSLEEKPIRELMKISKEAERISEKERSKIGVK